MKRTCKQCGKEFEITDSEVKFYKEKNFDLPKRCKACRDANKNVGNQKNNNDSKVNQNNYQKSNSNNNNKRNNSKIYKWVAAVAASVAVVATGINFIPDNNESAKYENAQPTKYTKDDNKTTSGDNSENENNTNDGSKSQATNEPAATKEATTTEEPVATEVPQDTAINYTFRTKKNLESHYEKHGIEMGFESAADYQSAASDVVNNPDALHKLEAEDGDDVYYLESTNEFVIVSPDGYLRTYFLPDAGKDYYDRQ